MNISKNDIDEESHGFVNINDELDKKLSKILIKYKNNKNKEITNLVLSGGGLKGLATLGALKYLFEKDILQNLKSIAGTSAGAIIGALYCVGYSFEEMFKIFLKLDYTNIIIPNPANILESFSLDTGERIEFVLTKLIESKNLKKTITLKEVYNICKINLIITATCLNDNQVYYFSHINSPDMPLLTSIRMSSAVPIIFKPILYKEKMYIDGGIIDNYPMVLFKNDIDRTLGIYVKDLNSYKKSIDSIESYARSLFECAMEGNALTFLNNYKNNTILIELPHMSLLENIDEKTKKKIHTIGYETTKKILKNKNNIIA